MADITISDTLLDPNGTFPTTGTLTFTLSEYFVDSAGKIRIPNPETASISAVDGTFSIVLSSTRDGTPTSRSYSVQLSCVISGTTITINLGSFTLEATPTTQQLSDLLIAGMATAESLNAHVDHETPTGSVNSVNTVFTLAYTPIAGTVLVFLNGVLQEPSGTDYSISGTTITFIIPPLTGQRVRCFYRKA